MRSTFCIAALIAAFFATSAIAQDAAESSASAAPEDQGAMQYRPPHKGMHGHRRGKHEARMMESIDVNQDGQVDLTEFMQHAEQRFNEMDRNGNGFVTREEMRATGEEMRKRHRKAKKEAHKAYKESMKTEE